MMSSSSHRAPSFIGLLCLVTGSLGMLVSRTAAAERLLLEEHFSSAASLGAWKRTVGAQNGRGAQSSIAWDAGAVRLSGDSNTHVWTALVREVEVPSGSWLRISGRMRTEDVTGGPLMNCNLFVKHEKGIVGTRIVTGTTTWTEVRRRFAVPTGARRVTVGLFLSLPGRAWFDDVLIEAVPAPAWSESTSGRYRYLTLPGDAVPAEARRYNEESYRIVSSFLGVAEPSRVTFFKYPDLATKEELTGRVGNAHREGQVIHSIWPTDRHEIVHVLADRWGDPPALIAEGLAVHLSGGWQGKPVRSYARDLVKAEKWIPPSALLTSFAFRAKPDLATYAVAGALVEWVLKTRGAKMLRSLYTTLRNTAPEADLRRRLVEALGVSLDRFDADLLAYVGR
jgi:hypothetical protein